MQISPTWPCGTSLPSSSRIDDLGRGNRQADGTVELLHVERIDRRCRRGFGQAVSLQQRGSRHLEPFFGNRPLHRHAAAQRHIHGREIELGKIGVVEQRVEQRVDAGHHGNRILAPLLDEAGNVARVGNQQVARTDHQEGQAVRRQREDVIQRQGGDDEFLAFTHHRT